MIELKQIKTILQLAGISQLKIRFDDDSQSVFADFVFKGKPGIKQLKYENIIKSLAIGLPGPPVAPGAARVQQLSDLPGEI